MNQSEGSPSQNSLDGAMNDGHDLLGRLRAAFNQRNWSDATILLESPPAEDQLSVEDRLLSLAVCKIYSNSSVDCLTLLNKIPEGHQLRHRNLNANRFYYNYSPFSIAGSEAVLFYSLITLALAQQERRAELGQFTDAVIELAMLFLLQLEPFLPHELPFCFYDCIASALLCALDSEIEQGREHLVTKCLGVINLLDPQRTFSLLGPSSSEHLRSLSGEEVVSLAQRKAVGHVKMSLRDLARFASFTSRREGLQIIVENEVKSDPMVSVCMGTYRDGEWLKRTVDGYIKNADYSNFELVLAVQKLDEEDTSSDFLKEEPYVNEPRLKVHFYDRLLGAEGGKLQAIKHSQGDIIIVTDAHCLPSRSYMKRVVQRFTELPFLNVLSFSCASINDDLDIGYPGPNHAPYDLCGFVGVKTTAYTPTWSIRPGLFLRPNLYGFAYALSRRAQNEIGSFPLEVISGHSWGDRFLGICVYLYGFYIFGDPTISVFHRWKATTFNVWRQSVRKLDNTEYPISTALDALKGSFLLVSDSYRTSVVEPRLKSFSGDLWEPQYRLFQQQLPELEKLREQFWKGARRSLVDYWMEFEDLVLAQLDKSEISSLLMQPAATL